MGTLCGRNIEDPWSSHRYLVQMAVALSHLESVITASQGGRSPFPTRQRAGTTVADHLAGIHHCSSSMLGHVDQRGPPLCFLRLSPACPLEKHVRGGQVCQKQGTGIFVRKTRIWVSPPLQHRKALTLKTWVAASGLFRPSAQRSA